MARVRPVVAPVLLGVLAWGHPAHAEISGTVTEAMTGQPLGGVLVSVQATDWETQTAADGTFSLPDADGDDLRVVAAARGYFYASAIVPSTPAMDVALMMEPVPVEDDPGYEFAPPNTCSECHPEQYQAWLDSPMASAGANSWVQDIYDGTGTADGSGGFVYTRDSAHAMENVASECAACHEPETWIAQPGSPIGSYSMPSAQKRHGVACDVCHKIADIDVTRPNFPGIWEGVVTMTRPATIDWNVQYGLLGDSDYVSIPRMRASYQPQLAADVCAACHQDKNDHDGDGDFEDEGGVISEPTYLEWLDSPYADPADPQYATCVDCHMPATGATAACDQLPDLVRPDTQVRGHAILGTTPEFLESSIALEMTASPEGESIEVDVTITNDRVGHHVPTGVTIRNMILLVEAVRDQDGLALEPTGDEVLHDLAGVGDPTDGYFAGLPGKLYAKANHGPDGTGPVFFTDATGITFDTRIPALGVDSTHYSFAVPANGGDLRVRARVIYRRSWRTLVDAKGWTEDGHGNPLADLAAPNFGHLMAEAEELIEVPYVPPGGTGTGTETGAGTETGTDSGGAMETGSSGCGCTSTGPTGAYWAFLLLGWRRR